MSSRRRPCRSRSPGRVAPHGRPRIGAAATLAAVAAFTAGCGGGGSGARTGAGVGRSKLEVVAAENFWGSIAAQLGGVKVRVRSIIVNPAIDPHSYEPTPQDARAFADARLAIINGVGYDEWAGKLLKADPQSGRMVLNAGDVVGTKQGENPHRWYYPSDVRLLIAQIAADYERLDPADAAYFSKRRAAFEARSLVRYDELRARIRAAYGGVPVGYSESIFQGLGEDLHLRLATPYSFAKAISEGSEVTAQDKRTVDEQAERRSIRVWVLNSQNVTPDVQRVSEIARARGIPVATLTETLSPAGDSFQQWQAAELEGLAGALHEATGR